MRVPKKGMLCGYCGHPVIRHMQAVEEFVPDTREGADPGRLRKQLYHRKKCWSKELRARIDGQRADDRLLRSIELAKKSLEDAGGPEAIRGGTMSEEQLIEMALRDVGRKRPQLVSERARAIVIGEDVELPDTLIAAESEDGRPSATFELPVVELPAPKVKIPRGQLQLAVRTAIEARAGWWTREQIRDDVKLLGLETTVETIDTTLWTLGRKLALERRKIGTGRSTKLCEYRVVQPHTPPPMLDQPSVKVERPQKVRHSTRPTYWEKQERAEIVKGYHEVQASVGMEPTKAAKEEPPSEDVARALAKQDEFNEYIKEKERVMTEQPSNGMSPRVRNALFVLRSEKMLNDLERTMMQLVQETIKSAREQITKLVEEEL